MSVTNLDPYTVKEKVLACLDRLDDLYTAEVKRFYENNKIVKRKKYFFFGKEVSVVLSADEAYVYHQEYFDRIYASEKEDEYTLHSILKEADSAILLGGTIKLDTWKANLISSRLTQKSLELFV